VEVTKDGKRVATLGGGDFVGEIALINHSRTATVTTTSQLHCFVLTSGEFRRALDDNRNIERKVMQRWQRAWPRSAAARPSRRAGRRDGAGGGRRRADVRRRPAPTVNR
jgi:CRP-like cAMP-binding protein